MKKSIKIILLTIFIVLFLGITTSNVNALVVKSDTTADKMISTITKPGGFLTGIDNRVRIKNSALYCRQHRQHIDGTANYTIDTTVHKKVNNEYKPISFPEGGDGDDNYYAKAYILAAKSDKKGKTYGDNTSNGLKQCAWWGIQGNKEENCLNALYDIARAYQAFMTDYTKFKKSHDGKAVEVVIADSAEVTDNGKCYGPIKITYAYSAINSGDYFDEWGGFDYKFVDSNGNEVSGVELYYNDTQVETNVRTKKYCGENLYVKTDGTVSLNDLELKVTVPKIVMYSAEVYYIAGTYTNKTNTKIYCLDCQEKMEDAISLNDGYTGVKEMCGDAVKKGVNTYIQYDGAFYVYTGEYINRGTYTNEYDLNCKNQYVLTGNGKSTKFEADKDNGYPRLEYKCTVKNEDFYVEIGKTSVVCDICIRTGGASTYDAENLKDHYKKSHSASISKVCAKKVYDFKEVDGCNCDLDDNIQCGDWSLGTLNSQKLFIVKSTKSSESNETEIGIDIKVTHPPITVTKTWSDSENRYGKRPDSIKFTLYGINGNTTTKIGTYTITEKDGWKKTFNDIPMYEKYKIEETTPESYAASYSSGGKTDGTIVNNEITITNTIIGKDIEIIKVWDDNGNQYGTRPSQIKVLLQRTANKDDKELSNKSIYKKWEDWDKVLDQEWKNLQSITAKNNWNFTFENVNIKNGNGFLCFHKVTETDEGLSNEDKNKLKCYFTTYKSWRSSTGTWAENPYVIITSKISKVEITNTLKTLDIDITKIWDDYNNAYGLRPTDTTQISFEVSRSTDQKDWTPVDSSEYTFEWSTKKPDSKADSWTGKITGLLAVDPSTGKNYYYKVKEVITGTASKYYEANSKEILIAPYNDNENIAKQTREVKITNELKTIEISGYVWLDGQTGIKPVVSNNGIMDDTEFKMKGIAVYLYYKNPTTGEISEVARTSTNEDGYYKFKDKEIGNYYVEFVYDGINYEGTIPGGDSKAFEKVKDRDTFNKKFQTIEKGNAIGADGNTITLKYDYDNENEKSTLSTTKVKYEVKEKHIETYRVKPDFIMNAVTNNGTPTLFKENQAYLNLGLVKRGTDIALSTDVADAKVTINGQETKYEYNNKTIEIGSTQSSTATYNLNLYTSDYNYRIKDYVSNSEFKENGFVNEENPEGAKTGDELKVYVTYALNLQNQSTETVKINEVKYLFDDKYEFVGIEKEIKNFKEKTENNETKYVEVDTTEMKDGDINCEESENNTITIKLNNFELGNGVTKKLYLVFEVKNNEGLTLGDFTNKAEITSYSTDDGLIDVDSQPGNFINNVKPEAEDDSDTAGGLKIQLAKNTERKITGKVFDEDNKNVNDVIVQLIELKTVNEKVYEYIWQETVSGTGEGQRIKIDGTELETYTYTKADGTYEFAGFIPGDYIVRFIYGDGTTYDMTENVIKYNGQDYKSMTDSNYKTEWYNSSIYTAGASVARDNEARRLETIAYSAEIDAQKGILLKLLNNPTLEELNETEKETLIAIYNKEYDPDITEATTEVINKLLKDQVLKNTWMCAETSKIKVAVDTANIAETATEIKVNGIDTTTYISEISNINLGLELRPTTQIELKKYITGFKLLASNGQTLVNASIDINNYFNNEEDKSTYVQGIKDSVTILGTKWQYEVAPVDINSVVDGANLEFQYTLVVKNTGEDDYISETLADAYNSKRIEEYKTYLNDGVAEVKGYMRYGTYSSKIGTYIGSNYYKGGNSGNKVLTEVTNIRDYINNDLTFVTSGGNVAVDETVSNSVHRILRDDYSMQTATIKTILKTTQPTGKMQNNGEVVLYTVTLGKNPISSTGNLNFENYIAEVMSYTNAVGRRSMTSTPGNAEIIDHENREGKTHEIDEADTASIQIGTATGEDEKANYIIIIAVAGALVVMAIGAILVKKYVIK